jgi:ubiquinone/menaquinone biosynthesis C-methylase UbiE
MEREFDRYAAEYDELIRDPIRDRFAQSAGYFHARKWDLLRRFFRKHSFDTKRSAWLDLGCGKGDLLQLGTSAFREVAGCDPSPNMLGACPGLQVRLQSSATEIPFDDNSFDLITAVCVYHHVELADRAALTLTRTLICLPQPRRDESPAG